MRGYRKLHTKYLKSLTKLNMRKDTKENPIIGRKVMTLEDIQEGNRHIPKGTICMIFHHKYSYRIVDIDHLCRSATVYGWQITDNFKLTITHYECVKDGKILLSSDEPIEVENIEEFKKNAHKLIVCDEVKVTYKAEER